MKSKGMMDEMFWELTDIEDKRIDFIIRELQKVKKEKKVSEDNYQIVKNIYREVDDLKEFYTDRIFKALKRGHSFT